MVLGVLVLKNDIQISPNQNKYGWIGIGIGAASLISLIVLAIVHFIKSGK